MSFILACDYDGTLFANSWPEKGKPKQDIIDKVKEFKKYVYMLQWQTNYTMRELYFILIIENTDKWNVFKIT